VTVDLGEVLARSVALPAGDGARLIALNVRAALLASICRRALFYVPAAHKRGLEDELDAVLTEIRLLCSHPSKPPTGRP
jgi:hypothetical protein